MKNNIIKKINQFLAAFYTRQLATTAKLSCLGLVIAFATCNKAKLETSDLKKPVAYSSVSIVNGTYKIDSNIATANGTKQKLLAKLETENLIEKKTIEEIPAFIRSFLDNISPNKTFDMANPGQEWQEGGWVNFNPQKKSSAFEKHLSTKQMVYCGISKNMALISYYSGGIRMTQHMAVIKFEDKKIIDLWFNNNGNSYNSSFVLTKDGIIKYIKTTVNGNC